jgi:hypothetical protein
MFNMESKIQPLEDYVLAGFSSRFQQVFNCICLYATATDKMKALERVFGGREVTYPYALFTIQTLASNNESYVNQSLARRGLTTVVKDGFLHTVRLMPANFEIEIEYYTNRYQGLEQGSVLAFVKRWLFARRLGYLKFNINYGSLTPMVGVTMSESLTLPPRENSVEQETVYKTVTTATIHGYISEASLGTKGVIQQLDVEELVLNPDGSVPGYQFFSFNKE